jgi:hypothetical protein
MGYELSQYLEPERKRIKLQKGLLASDFIRYIIKTNHIQTYQNLSKTHPQLLVEQPIILPVTNIKLDRLDM